MNALEPQRKGRNISRKKYSRKFVARNIITALDIGTSTVQTVVAERAPDRGSFRILGVGEAASAGVRRGAVVDVEDASSAVRRSVEEARRGAGVTIRSVWLGVDGTYVSASTSRGVVAVSRADQEISPEDVRRALAAAETFVPKNRNKEILHMIPREFKVDNEAGIRDPSGMHGVRLEVEALVIEASAPHLKALFKCVEGAGLRVQDYVFSPLAAAEAVLSKRQKELGVILLDIGGGSASFIVFEEGAPVHAGAIPIGGNHITGDVAIGLRTNIDIAERMKLAYGTCAVADLPKRDAIRLAEFVPDELEVFSRRTLAEIVEARMQDLFELLAKELRRINRARLLPGGVVLIGGSSLLPGIVPLTKRELGLPAEQGMPQGFQPVLDDGRGPQLAAALGIASWAAGRTETASGWQHHIFNGRGHVWMRWLKSLLP